MRVALGTAAVWLGAVASLYAVVMFAVGLPRRDERMLRAGRRGVALAFGAAVAAFGVMEWALFSHDFSIEYVAGNVARATPGLYTFTALWGALEGSILLWTLFVAGYAGWTVHRFRSRADDPIVGWATLTAMVVVAFFFVVMLVAANPFTRIAGAIPLDGEGPNPLLQNHPLMAFHPPMLYLGYVGFTIPFAFGIAGLVTGRVGEEWLSDTRRATLIAWGFLTGGVILGAWWSYEVLGWGGYWAWDPVENASLLPWITGTAFLHSVMARERQGMLRVWNLSLVIATFCLTILGTFLTRSGVVASVHAFSRSSIGPWLLGFLGVSVLVGVGLIAWRGDALRGEGRVASPASRESAFLANNLVFSAFALVVLLGTVYPLLAEALQDRQVSVGEPYFDRMTAPLGMAILFLMAVAPLLPWRGASGEVLNRRLLVPAWIGGSTIAIAALVGVRGVAQVLTFGLAAFALAGIVDRMVAGVRSRRRSDGEPLLKAIPATVLGRPRLYGGLIVHAGVVLIAVAIAASSGYSTKREVRLDRGESATVAGYAVTYLGRAVDADAQKTTIKADIKVERGGDDLGVYSPAISTYPNFAGGIGTPSVRTGLLRDLYLTLVSSPNESRIALGVAVNPLVLWLWVGGAVMGLGVLVSLLPAQRASRRAPAPVESPVESPARSTLDSPAGGAMEPVS
ncbi:MAG: heme lyase CcmF/NrfE family subunit [Acidimicrobiia bacterium]|nr:heme lyase CcmF/NrfE family subunit [Acidimicrobiia bacterium]